MSRPQSFLVLTTAFFTALLAPAPASAGFTLSFHEVGTTTYDKTITDGGSGDLADGADGNIAYLGNVGDFNVTFTTGTSSALTGVSPGTLTLTEGSVSLKSNTGPKTLVVTLRDDQFVAPLDKLKVLTTSLAGSSLGSGGTVSAIAYVNGQSGTGIALAVGRGNGYSAGSSDATNLLTTNGGNYTLTLVVTISLQSKNDQFTGSANAEVSPAPAPQGLVLLASALPFAGLLRLRRRKGSETPQA